MAYNVLVVDDSDVIRAMISKTLRLADIQVGKVMEAANGQEALDLLKGEWIDLVFADINMPVMDGLTMVARMQEDGLLASIPVIVVSTEGGAPRIEELAARGIAAYVRKPFTPELIRDVVNQVLDGARLDEPVASGMGGLEGSGDVLCDVAEWFACMLSDPVEDDAQTAAEEPLVLASMSFSGPVSGTLALAASEAVCAKIAANVLGLEPDDSVAAANARDSLKEVLNITCGHVATMLAGDAVFDLSPPEVRPIEGREWDEVRASEGAGAYLLDGEPVLLRLTISG